ncbi:MAG TPA: hypothetical protein VGQ65_20965 [Thermoanaerobaculia bacterium]|nr:hypothetical protein [Thermoanaerobaculia bacterium]
MLDANYYPEHDRLISDLRQNGFAVEDIWDWVNGLTPAGAESILISHLELDTSDRLVEAIARALTQKNFTNALPALLRRFERAREEYGTGWVIGNAIACQPWPKHLWETILSLAADPKFGRNRQMLVWCLHQIKLPAVEPTLIKLVDDQNVGAHALIALRRGGSIESWKTLRTVDPTGRSVLFKRELKKIAKRLDKRLQKTS